VTDDGWSTADAVPPQVRTTLSRDATRRVITYNQSPDLPFDRSINPYRGCEHGCIYCFARPSHAFLGLSPGLDFETRLFAKPDAARLLERELRRPGYEPRALSLGTNTDPYQPVEKQQRITRSIIEVLSAFNHPVTIVTKSALVLRDIDILAPMAARRLAKVAISVTTLDRRLARSMEPRASTPTRRIETIRTLADAGIPALVMVAPVIPGLTDWELERILHTAHQVGATEAGYVLLRLPLEVKDLFREWLQANAPERASRVLGLVRAARGGKDYDSDWGQRLTGSGAYADLIGQRFRLAAKRLALNASPSSLDTSQFHRPCDEALQLDLFSAEA
jgi:DNA repair photolyase